MVRIRSGGGLAALLVMLAGLDGCSGGSGPSNNSSVSASSEISTDNYVVNEPTDGSFPLFAGGAVAPLVVADNEFAPVARAAGDLQNDLQMVTGARPTLASAIPAGAKLAVLIGTVGQSSLIDGLVSSKKLDVGALSDKGQPRWETFVIQVVPRPAAGVDQALVIAGSDKRGTVYGIYDLSRRIGVSPWYFWDDVVPRQQSALYVRAGRYSQGTPAVKYRGFFINDENPQTGTWAATMFGPGKAPGYPGGLNHAYYERIFEVMLRLRANYLWPAVWGRAFFEDDPDNQATADRYGIVMGTSHEAPMNRGIEEWNRHAANGMDPYGGNGSWSFKTNEAALRAYWADGAKRIGDSDVVVTLGMRGNGDFGAPDLTSGDQANIQLMTSIVDAQRQILHDNTGRELSAVPQVFTLYKEVQRFWDGGMKLPDDVTVVFCDDNWGNLKRVPDAPRPGGYGIYYHFDYVGGPRNYKWVDTSLLPNVWEQLNLAYASGVDRIFMFNAGDMKGNEVPLQFALDYAWDPQRLPLEAIPSWESDFAAQQFGDAAAASVAGILHDYELLQSDRKPELTDRKVWLEPSVPAPTPASGSNPAYAACTTPDQTNDSCIAYSDDSLSINPSNAHRNLSDPANGDSTIQPVYTDDNPFSLTQYRELERVTEQWQDLAARAETAGELLSAEQQDAYFELVLYPVQASAALYALRLAEFKNILYAGQRRAAINDLADQAQRWFAAGVDLANRYNQELAGGKWQGWQTQPYVDYGDRLRPGNLTPWDGYYANRGADGFEWQQPEANDKALPDVLYPAVTRIDPQGLGQVGVMLDGADINRAGTAPFLANGEAGTLPAFSLYQTQPAQYFEVFNRGATSLDFTIEVAAPGDQPDYAGHPAYQGFDWLTVTPSQGTLDATTKEVRVTVSVDWARLPSGAAITYPLTVPITVKTSLNETVTVNAVVQNQTPADWAPNRFVEANGVVSIEAAHFSRAVDKPPVSWKLLPDIGRTGSGMTIVPVTADRQTPGGDGPRLEYDVYLFSNVQQVNVAAYLSPRNNTRNRADGLRYAISIDDGAPQAVEITKGIALYGNGNRVWERVTGDNVNITTTTHTLSGAGAHVVKLWAVDPTVILQKLVIDTGGLKPSYLGPPESYRTGAQ
jgi:hypothetical protein